MLFWITSEHRGTLSIVKVLLYLQTVVDLEFCFGEGLKNIKNPILININKKNIFV